MEGESNEFQDWEVLNHASALDLEEEAAMEMEGDPEGMVRPDYFSIDSHQSYAKTVSGVDLSEEQGSADPDNPTRVDPDSENRSDSSIDRSNEPRSDARHALVSVGDANSGSFDSDECKYRSLDAKSELGLVENDKSEVGFAEIMVSMKLGDAPQQSEMDGLGMSVEFEGGNSSCSNMEPIEGDENLDKESRDGAIVAMKPDANSVNVGDKRRVIWWKVPLQFLKYCAFRVSPVWSFSVAAALMGLIILGGRLSRMKRKTQSLQLKVTVDEKKVSLFKSRAARLNEAFSVVRRFPITHPAAGLTSWPVMTLR